MARKPRLFVPGATYHVYCRVARGEFVFDDPYEAEEFVEKVREVRETYDWRILMGATGRIDLLCTEKQPRLPPPPRFPRPEDLIGCTQQCVNVTCGTLVKNS